MLPRMHLWLELWQRSKCMEYITMMQDNTGSAALAMLSILKSRLSGLEM
jgi:hypothetical protein